MRFLLPAAEAVYTSVNAMRRWFYRRGILRPRRLPRPVVSIGNIAAGGTGKTPAVIALANELSRRGASVAVLTRGYGRRGPSAGGLVTGPDADRFGDEPVVIKNRTKNVNVIVGKYRYKNAMKFLNDNPCDVFILDDGFQHLQLARDLDIVIEAPSSFYRERRSALADAGLVVPRRIRVTIPEPVRGRRAFAFAGLADTGQFFDSIRDAGLEVRGTMTFPDHHRYAAADLRRIEDAAAAAGAEVIVTTEKDAVKLDRGDLVPIPAEFVFDQAVIERVAALVGR
ncbi:MAG TPA: tetraacyldisaccharide 4'-kinase [Thermoanaerobaculia bacterium]|nr:tetraacyldisaccharide 4'-kinase [Thermoanaerobaculia bacterium]